MARQAAKTKSHIMPAYARSIGEAAGEMALLENRLGEAMAALLGIDAKLGRIIYLSSHTPFGRVATLDVIASSVLPAESVLLERLRGLTKRARELLTTHHATTLAVWDAASNAKACAAHTGRLATQARAAGELAREVATTTLSLRRDKGRRPGRT
jgi:hypothetical protein